MTEVGGNTDQFSATSTGTATRFREVRTILQGKKKKKQDGGKYWFLPGLRTSNLNPGPCFTVAHGHFRSPEKRVETSRSGNDVD